MVVKFTLENVFGNCRRNPRHFGAPGREESLELYSVLWSDWATSKQKVLRHGNRFADAIFRRERSDDRKCVCCSQMSINKKSGQKTFRRRFVSGSIFVLLKAAMFFDDDDDDDHNHYHYHYHYYYYYHQ